MQWAQDVSSLAPRVAAGSYAFSYFVEHRAGGEQQRLLAFGDLEGLSPMVTHLSRAWQRDQYWLTADHWLRSERQAERQRLEALLATLGRDQTILVWDQAQWLLGMGRQANQGLPGWAHDVQEWLRQLLQRYPGPLVMALPSLNFLELNQLR